MIAIQQDLLQQTAQEIAHKLRDVVLQMSSRQMDIELNIRHINERDREPSYIKGCSCYLLSYKHYGSLLRTSVSSKNTQLSQKETNNQYQTQSNPFNSKSWHYLSTE